MAAHTRTLVQCASPLCPPHRGRHTQSCLDDPATKCDGCLPRSAADGLRLCQLCARLLAEDPATLATRYRALELVLAGGGASLGMLVATSRDPNLQLNAAAADARAQIRGELTGLVRLVVEERGVHLPTTTVRRVQPRPDGLMGPMPLQVWRQFFDTSVPVLAGFLGKHATWLAAHAAAGEHAQVLRDLARGTFAVAYPNGTRLFPIRLPEGGGVAVCPESVTADVDGAPVSAPCPGSLWTVLRPRDDRLPAEVLCNAEQPHRWPAREWLSKLGPLLMRQAKQQQDRRVA